MLEHIVLKVNKYLFKTAREAGVENFGKFNNYGYKGLYNGETAKQIAKRKNIKESEDILDYMGSEELGANLFRITQTEAKLKKDNINKLKQVYDVDVSIVQDDEIKPGKFEVKVIKTYDKVCL